MPFKVEIGDLFANVEHGLIMHGCNAQGVMGSGVAAIVKRKYPIAFQKYAEQHPNYILGEVIPVIVEPNLIIINAITQEWFGTDRVHADYDAINQACKGAIHLAESGMIESTDIHLPLIGGGLAGGDHQRLLDIFETRFTDVEPSATLWLLE